MNILLTRIKIFLKSSYFWISFIFASAAFFRIFFLDLIEFKADEALSLFQTYQFFKNPHIIQTGLITSIQTHNFPLFNYLLIILSLFTRNPQFVSFVIALINSILVVSFYLIVRKYYGNLTASFAAFLLAFSPWAILFSRKIWAQDLILLVVIPIFYLIHRLVFDKDRRAVFWIFLLLTLLIQLHNSGFFFAFVTVGIILILKRKRVVDVDINIKTVLFFSVISLSCFKKSSFGSSFFTGSRIIPAI